jgi:TonB-dependent starch-binding outer membrane protein SusC
LTRSWEKQALVNTSGGSAGGVIMDALRISPTVPVRDGQGNYTVRNAPLQYVEGQVGNPVAYAERVKDNRKLLRGLFNAAGEYEILKGLKLRVSGGVNLLYEDNDTYIPSGLWYQSQIWSGQGTKAAENNYSWINENTLTYDRQIGKNHALNVVLGVSEQEFYREDFSTSANNFFTNTLGTDELGFGALVNPPASSKSKNSLASYFGRINYRLMEKYLFTFTMRADGSSRFGANNKWGYFPSAAFAWRMIDEDFINRLNIFSDLKLRASYGVTGNQEIGSYQSVLRYQNFTGQTTRTDYISGTTRLIGVARANIPNPDLTWESTSSFNIGLDMGFFQNRLSITADYYQKKTSDLLLNVAIPQTTGHSSILLNAGSVENKGFELAVNTINIDAAKFQWSSNLNFSTNRNKVTDMNGERQRVIGQASNSIFAGNNPGTNVLRVGEPIGSFYGYQFDGIWQTQEEITASGIKAPVLRAGDPKYIDQDGNGIINADDRVIIGRAQPDFIYGLTNSFTYGPFNLSILLQGVQGASVLNLNRYELENGMVNTNKIKSVKDSWTGPGTSNTLPKVNSTVRRSTGITSDLVEDASFLRVKTVSLGYNIPLSSTITKVLKSASIYVTAQNLLTFTKYSGYDPEVNSFGTSNDPNSSPNTDYNAYPSSKTFIGGIKLGF